MIKLLPVLLLSGCFLFQSDATPTEGQQRLQNILHAFSDAVVQTKVTEVVKEKYPNLMPIFDVNQDGVLSLDEINNMDLEDSSTFVVIIIAVEQLLNGSH